ncbi:uncharacterized protein [Clytia hemisphaerica]|uniref:uncharacterized protein n=1 Tax=Clytia hemisphaerica TaxID=252671 RepID=UPI0034D69617
MTIELSKTENEERIQTVLDTFTPRIDYFVAKIVEKQTQISKLMKQSKITLDGACVTGLEEVLQSLNVERQAYHSRSFIGNHVQKMLEEESIVKLCQSMPDNVAKKGLADTSIHSYAKEIAGKFKKLFEYYANCHNIIGHAEGVGNDVIDELQSHIVNLMDYYRATWKKEGITPKMHLLEDHVVPFLRKWNMAFGIYGEQGMESLHVVYNGFKKNYVGMPVGTERLKATLDEHFLQVSPHTAARRPKVKTRKRKKMSLKEKKRRKRSKTQ